MATKLPEHIKELLKEYIPPERINDAAWDCHGTWVVKNWAISMIATALNITFDAPHIVEYSSDKKLVVLCVTGRDDKGKVLWSFGEAAPSNNKNNYPFAMAEKRAKGRVTLNFADKFGLLYTEDDVADKNSNRPFNDPTIGSRPRPVPGDEYAADQ